MGGLPSAARSLQSVHFSTTPCGLTGTLLLILQAFAQVWQSNAASFVYDDLTV